MWASPRANAASSDPQIRRHPEASCALEVGSLDSMLKVQNDFAWLAVYDVKYSLQRAANPKVAAAQYTGMASWFSGVDTPDKYHRDLQV
jgi:hypothetical protein